MKLATEYPTWYWRQIKPAFGINSQQSGRGTLYNAFNFFLKDRMLKDRWLGASLA